MLMPRIVTFEKLKLIENEFEKSASASLRLCVENNGHLHEVLFSTQRLRGCRDTEKKYLMRNSKGS